MLPKGIHLGCGLIGIGREWGYKKTEIPSERVVLDFLENAYNLGIRYFDTAPSYGLSEERLGKFLQHLLPDQRKEIIVATKFGEYWDVDKHEVYTDHKYNKLVESLDQSFERLGKIDVLQLHKTSPEVLKSIDLQKAWLYAQKAGISYFGASVSDIISAKIVCEDPNYQVIQLPFNSINTLFADIIKLAKSQNKFIVINRPFQMGEILYSSAQKGREEEKLHAYHYILEKHFNGIILTGTKDRDHLKENMTAFQTAQLND